jgi:hypothetical protein
VVRFQAPKRPRTTKHEDDWESVFLPSSTELRLSSRWEGASTLSPSANTIFAQIPGSGGDQIYFHAGISFTIVTQSYLKIGRRDRQEGTVVFPVYETDRRFFKVQKKFPPKK